MQARGKTIITTVFVHCAFLFLILFPLPLPSRPIHFIYIHYVRLALCSIPTDSFQTRPETTPSSSSSPSSSTDDRLHFVPLISMALPLVHMKQTCLFAWNKNIVVSSRIRERKKGSKHSLSLSYAHTEESTDWDKRKMEANGFASRELSSTELSGNHVRFLFSAPINLSFELNKCYLSLL